MRNVSQILKLCETKKFSTHCDDAKKARIIKKLFPYTLYALFTYIYTN